MIETNSAYISKVDDDTIKLVFKPNVTLKNEEYASYYDHYKALLGIEKEMKFFIIIQEGFKIEDKYINFFKKKYRIGLKKAEAYIIFNPASRMFFKVGLHVVKREYPIKLFTTEEEALKWLKTIK